MPSGNGLKFFWFNSMPSGNEMKFFWFNPMWRNIGLKFLPEICGRKFINRASKNGFAAIVNFEKSNKGSTFAPFF